MLKKQEVYSALTKIVESNLENTSQEDLITVALAVWHEGFSPSIEWSNQLKQQNRLVLGYVLEFLAGFNVLCSEERQRLLDISEKLRPPQPSNIKPNPYRDELATEWGLEYDLSPYFEYISDFQTRHYTHNSEYKRPSPNFIL